MSAAPRNADVGVALTARRLVAVDPRAGRAVAGARAWSRDLEPLGEGAEWASLVAALRDLRDVRGQGGSVSIALLPPLVDVRPLALPSLPPDELRRLVSRGASRYFLGAREPQVVAVAAPPRGRRGASGPVVAAAVDARRVDANYAAAAAAGWTIRTIVPAEAAWRAAAIAEWPALARGVGELAVVQPDRIDLLRLDDGRLTAVRRGRAPDAHGLRPSGETRDDVLHVFGDPSALRTLGTELVTPRNAGGVDPLELAAAYASRGAGLELIPDQAWRIRRARLWRATATVVAAAVLLLVIAGLLQAAALRRQLLAVRAERARLRPQVAGVLATQEALALTSRRLGELATAPRRAARWSTVLETLSEYVPDGAYLTSLTGHADTLVVEGVAETSGDVFDALGEARTLANVRVVAPVRRDFRSGGDASEHFTIGARVVGVEPTPKAVVKRAPTPQGARP